MPGMDGYETCRRFRQNAVGQLPAIVALTGWGQERDKERARESGFDAHLTKPCDIATLTRLFAELDERPSRAQPLRGSL
jgi:CheY-like chemotaxis protein